MATALARVGDLGEKWAICRAEDYVQITLAVLEWESGRTMTMAYTRRCSRGEADPRWNWYRVARRYRLDDLDPRESDGYFYVLHKWWNRSGFRVLADRRPAWNYLWLESPHDGFRLAFAEGNTGQISLAITSPAFRAGALDCSGMWPIHGPRS